MYFRYKSNHDSKVKSYSASNLGEGVASVKESIAEKYKDNQGFYSVLEKTIDEKINAKITK